MPASTEVEFCVCGHNRICHHDGPGNTAPCQECFETGKECQFFDPGDMAGRLQELPKDILTAGQGKVDGARQQQHGDPVPNMERFAALLSGYFGIPVSSHDAAMVQLLFKVTRTKANPLHMDNYDDMEGYAEIGRRCANANWTDPTNP